MRRAPFTHPPAPRWRRLVVSGYDLVQLADVLIALFAFLSTIAWLTSHNDAHGHPQSGATLAFLAVILCVPVMLRTRFPASAWLASAGTITLTNLVIPVHELTGGPWIPQSLLVYALCLYSVAVRCSPPLVITAAAVSVLGATAVDARTAAISLLAMFPLLGGTIVRVRRSARSELSRQAQRHEGEVMLLAERQRIARELHDVVAHHMSVIAIHAEAAPYKVTDPPAELVESFVDIRSSALKGLAELRRVLGVLRDDAKPDTTPQPSLARLEELVEGARGAGLTVTVHRSGEHADVPDGVDLSAYRILQETLSNAMRHAPGSTVEVTVAYRTRGLFLEVRNTPGATPQDAILDGGGHGIAGMRERATMLGGELDAGPTLDGGFAVTAVLPYARAAAYTERDAE